jgi:hypothetical protein
MSVASEDGMEVRRITLADGRYLIFYTFDGEGADNGVENPQRKETQNESSREADRESRV